MEWQVTRKYLLNLYWKKEWQLQALDGHG
jgi:hypothetical protein